MHKRYKVEYNMKGEIVHVEYQGIQCMNRKGNGSCDNRKGSRGWERKEKSKLR
jgi:hypothetical protein